MWAKLIKDENCGCVPLRMTRHLIKKKKRHNLWIIFAEVNERFHCPWTRISSHKPCGGRLFWTALLWQKPSDGEYSDFILNFLVVSFIISLAFLVTEKLKHVFHCNFFAFFPLLPEVYRVVGFIVCMCRFLYRWLTWFLFFTVLGSTFLLCC